MIITHNIMALNGLNRLNKNNNSTTKVMEKLSSGMRINRASDDAAGLSISQKMRAQIRGMNQAERNAQDGISLIQTAEGGIASIHESLQRMRELCVQGANGTLNDEDRLSIQMELDQLKDNIYSTSRNTEFNGIKLLDGSLSTQTVTRTLPSDTPVAINFAQGTTVNFTVNESLVLDGSAVTFTGTIDDIKFSIEFHAVSTPDPFPDDIDFGSNNFTLLTYKGYAISAINSQSVSLTYSCNRSPLEVTSLTVDNLNANFEYFPMEEVQEQSTNSLILQVGANSGQTMTIAIDDMRPEALGLVNGMPRVVPVVDAQLSISILDDSIQYASSARSSLGAKHNALEHVIANVSNAAENLISAESRIRDMDMAKGVMEMVKSNILVQASQAMLAQANQVPQGVLQLLK